MRRDKINFFCFYCRLLQRTDVMMNKTSHIFLRSCRSLWKKSQNVSMYLWFYSGVITCKEKGIIHLNLAHQFPKLCVSVKYF